MRKLYPVLAALLVLATSGCAPQVDIEAERAILLEAVAEWSKVTGTTGVDGYLSFFADEATLLPPNNPNLTGKDAIREWASEGFAAPGFAVSWQPTQAEVSRTGDLGYTVGTYEVTVNDAEGNPVTERGKNLVIWKKQRDGSWKVVAGAWNSDQPSSASATD